MSVRNWRHRLEYLLFRLIVCVIDALSPRVTAHRRVAGVRRALLSAATLVPFFRGA